MSAQKTAETGYVITGFFPNHQVFGGKVGMTADAALALARALDALRSIGGKVKCMIYPPGKTAALFDLTECEVRKSAFDMREPI